MAAFNPDTFTETESAFEVAGNANVAIILTFYLLGGKVTVKAKTMTKTYEFRGLTRAQAKEMETSADYNYSSKTDAHYTKAGGAWLNLPDAEGAECRADGRRINEADMWRVVVTHSTTTVITPSGWTKQT